MLNVTLRRVLKNRVEYFIKPVIFFCLYLKIDKKVYFLVFYKKNYQHKKIYILRISSARSTKWCKNLSKKSFIFLDLKEMVFFFFVFKRF